MLIKNLKLNDEISDFFILHKKETLVTRTNSKYLNVLIGDKSGTIEGKLWNIEDDKDFSNINEGDIVFINGKVEKFKDSLQINVKYIEKKDVSENILNKLIPTTEKNINDLIKNLIYFQNSIETLDLRKLIDKIIFEESFFQLFKLAPAATKYHHAYRGGLLEHTLSVVKLCDAFSKIYSKANRDILITGAILHDIGKVYEYDNRTFKRTNEGKLLGHIAIGINIIDKKISKFKNFPENLSVIIKHLVLSHHGELEWGSPVQPLTLESILLHFADNIDSKVQTFLELDEKSGWQYNKSLRRNVLLDMPSELEGINEVVNEKQQKTKAIKKTLFSE